MCCSPWGRKELDMTEQLNNNKTDRRSSTSSNGGAAPIRHTHLQITVRVWQGTGGLVWKGQGARTEREGEGTYLKTLVCNQKQWEIVSKVGVDSLQKGMALGQFPIFELPEGILWWQGPEGKPHQSYVVRLKLKYIYTIFLVWKHKGKIPERVTVGSLEFWV